VRGGGGWADGNKRIETHRLVLNSLGLHAGLRCYALDDAEIEMQMLMLMLMETCALMQGGRSRISSEGGGGWADGNKQIETHRLVPNLLGLHAGLRCYALDDAEIEIQMLMLMLMLMETCALMQGERRRISSEGG
jgi:hypothetical protein